MSYKTAKEIKDAYFTKHETAKWCIDQLAKLYDLKGKSALEPAGGSGAFVVASQGTGLKWKTNELFLEFAQGFKHDFNVDFAKGDLSSLGTYDFVITNPPFGKSSSLARKFVRRSFEIAPVVAMILPKGCRRGSAIDKLPPGVKVMLDVDIPNAVFVLPDGSEKPVGCVFMVFEKIPGYLRPQILDYEPEGYRAWAESCDWPDWATHGVGLMYSPGKVFRRNERDKGFLATLWLKLDDRQDKLIDALDVEWLIARTKTSIPRLVGPEIITELNKLFKVEVN